MANPFEMKVKLKLSDLQWRQYELARSLLLYRDQGAKSPLA